MYQGVAPVELPGFLLLHRQLSKLEALIVKDESSGAADSLLGTLCQVFDHSGMLTLRCVCRIFERWITSSALFGILYVDPWWTCTKNQQWRALQNVRSLCGELVVNLPSSSAPCRASTGLVFDYSPDLPTIGDWPSIFAALKNLRTLTLCTPSSLKPSTQSSGIAGLLALVRQSFEQSQTRCSALRVQKLDASLLLFLKSTGPSYCSAKWLAGGAWHTITTLELQLIPPIRYSQQDTIRVLHSWLQSFQERLSVLKFAWLHGSGANRGPHPLGLDLVLREKAWSLKPLDLTVLKELWVANCANEKAVRPLLPWRANTLERYMVSREQTSEGEFFGFDEQNERWTALSINDLRTTWTERLEIQAQ